MRVILITIVALCIGVGCAIPNILGYLEFKKEYEPFSYFFTSDIPFDEATSYAPGASYFKETASLPFEMDIYEYRERPNLRYLLPDIFEGIVGYLLSDLRLGWLAIHLIFPMLSFLLAYLLAKKLTNNGLVACFAAVIFCTLGFGPRTFLNLFTEHVAQPVLFSRISPPAVTLPFLLIALIGLVKNHKRQVNSGTILAGIFGGLLFYTYYYYQVTYVTMLILLMLTYLLKKDWNKFIKILLVAIIANIVALPWYIQYFYTLKLSPDFVTRWLPRQHNFTFFEAMVNFSFLVLLIMSYMLWKQMTRGNKSDKFLDSGYLPLYMFVLTAIFIQCIMSRFVFVIIQPWHFYQHITHGFTTLIFTCLLGSKLLLTFRRYKLPMTMCICVLIMLLLVKQTDVWQRTKEYYRADPRELTAEEIVKKYTTHKDVIGISNPYLNSVFPSRLWRYRFYAFSGYSNIENRENLQRYVFIQKIFNQPWEKIEKGLIGSTETILSPLKKVTIPYLLVSQAKLSTPEIIESTVFYSNLDKGFLKSRRLSYVLCLDEQEERNFALGSVKLGLKAELVQRDKAVALYKIY